MKSLLFGIALIPALLFASCSGKKKSVDSEELCGIWMCEIRDGVCQGADTLFLRADSTIMESKGITYSSSDSGFEFRIGIKVGIRGSWKVSGDSLFVGFDPATLAISADKDSFELLPTGKNADTKMLDEVREAMCEDLADYVDALMREEYSWVSGKMTALGKLEYSGKDKMIISSGEKRVLLTRVR